MLGAKFTALGSPPPIQLGEGVPMEGVGPETYTTEYKIQNTEYRIQNTEYRIQNT
jgi:hypothetical protein